MCIFLFTSKSLTDHLLFQAVNTLFWAEAKKKKKHSAYKYTGPIRHYLFLKLFLGWLLGLRGWRVGGAMAANVVLKAVHRL